MHTPSLFYTSYFVCTTRPETLALTRTLGSDQCLDAVAGEGSWLIRATWMLCLELLDVDSVGSGCCGGTV